MELNAVMKRRAGLAIANTYSDYTKAGGVRDLEAQLAKANEGCSKHIFNLAAFVVSKSDDLADGASRFGAVCAYAEGQLKTAHSVDNLKDVLPVWSVYKSNILRGMKLGLDPTNYKSEGEMRAAMMEEIRSTVRSLQPSSRDRDEKEDDTEQIILQPSKPRVINIEDAELMVGSSTIIAPLKALVARLVVESEYIRRGKEQEAVRILTECVDALHALVDQRRIRDAATKEALAPSASPP